MKTFITAMTLAFVANTATAADLNATFEYGVEAEAFTTTLGVGEVFGGVYWTADFEAVDTDFTGVDLGAAYRVSETVSVFGVVEFDDSADYEEATIGIALSF